MQNKKSIDLNCAMRSIFKLYVINIGLLFRPPDDPVCSSNDFRNVYRFTESTSIAIYKRTKEPKSRLRSFWWTVQFILVHLIEPKCPLLL